jgi:hypothetical protein
MKRLSVEESLLPKWLTATRSLTLPKSCQNGILSNDQAGASLFRNYLLSSQLPGQPTGKQSIGTTFAFLYDN